jgi:hypothetical protein
MKDTKITKNKSNSLGIEERDSVKMNATEIVKAVQDEKLTKSAAIRQLSEQGLKTGEISKMLGIRFQFAYNVLHTIQGSSDEEKQAKLAARIAKKQEELRQLELKLK